MVEARILMPQGTPLAETAEIVRHINEAAARTNERFPDQPGGAAGRVGDVEVQREFGRWRIGAACRNGLDTHVGTG